MTTALEGGEGSASRPSRSLLPGKTRYPLYRRLGGPQGRSGEVRKTSPPSGFDSRTVQPVASRYTDYDTRPTPTTVSIAKCPLHASHIQMKKQQSRINWIVEEKKCVTKRYRMIRMYTTTTYVRHRDVNGKITGWMPNSKRNQWGYFKVMNSLTVTNQRRYLSYHNSFSQRLRKFKFVYSDVLGSNFRRHLKLDYLPITLTG